MNSTRLPLNGRNNDFGKQRPDMSNPKMRADRVAVAVAFGLIGFAVNFLDIEFMEGAAFKISILAGLFFPLVVALAWGWRYGLLSALAGGCQTMWWLWHGDGWGIFYSVPVFTLWIVWHGWWAEHRPEGHPWYVSLFAVEIPFRIVIELGFLIVFRWLVSLNPPPWNSAISWDHVSLVWLQTVAVKHVVEAYVLLMAAYVALSLGPVRRFFGLPPRSAQRDTSVIYAGATLFGLFLWILEALVHYFVFPRDGQTFWGIAVHGASAHEVFMRSVYVATAMLAGIVLARLNRRRVELQEILDHRNRVLAAIRNVNQLIVREKNPHRLLDEACRLLVETRGYYNVWIVLTTDGRPREPFFHAGFNGGFAIMIERLRAGDLPACAQAALSSDGVQMVNEPPAQCMACPLASKYEGHTGWSLRLEHAGCVFGWISLSCPTTFARSADEHDLLKEVAGDIAFALCAIETETQRETLAGKYAAVLATTIDAVVAVDLDGRITVFNPGAEKLFGCTADEAIETPLARFCPEERLAEQAEMMRRVRYEGAVACYESERLTADGRRIPVEITLGLNTDDQGRPLGISAILRNISERKQAEDALRKSEWYLRSTIDGLSAHIAVLDDRGEIILTNKAYRDFGERNGIEPDAVCEGANYLAVCDTASGGRSEEANPFAEGIREVLSGKRRSFELEYPCHSPDEKRWFVGRVTPFTGEGHRRVVVAHENITERRKAENVLRESEKKFSTAFQTSPYAITITRAIDGKFIEINDAFMTMTGFTREETLADSSIGLKLWMNIEDRDRVVNDLRAGRTVVGHEYQFRIKGDRTFMGSFSARAILLGGEQCILSCIEDITERKRAEEALNVSERRFKTLLQEVSTVAVQGYAMDGTVRYWNHASETVYGYTAEETIGRNLLDLIIPPTMRDDVHAAIRRMAETGETIPASDLELKRKDGSLIPVYSSHALVRVPGQDLELFCIDIDLTVQKQAESEREKLQSQLNQAQKMESVGRLAGGVAHDFNNMLGIIIGHADMILEQMDPDLPFHADLMEIRKAGERSADLTRQLLAFARKQTVAPKVIDLNDTLEGMTRMLLRLIGEDIDMAWIPGEKLWLVKIDPAQIDQILANLCVNARDAIAGVGKVTIETGNTVFDADYCRDHAGFVPGEYAMLAVSDTGCGMDSGTMSHLFEPFFTTKELGKGTGLGLATVYGVVKQNNGFITVYSEPGQGSTFRIYLPRHLAKAVPLPEKGSDKPSQRGHETVLLVEDEPAILKMTTMMLEREGYTVIPAGTPGQAIRLANEHHGNIHLLMSDVVMPEMNGRDLANNILSLYPHLKCLFMSGYTANVIAHRGILDESVNFIQKPFSKSGLTVKVREVLDRE